MEKFRALDSMHNRNVAQRMQFVVILNKIPENPKPNRNHNYVHYRTSTTNVLCHYAIGNCKVLSFCFVLRSLTTIIKAGNWVDFNFFFARLVIQSVKNGRWKEREHVVVWSTVGVSDHTLYVLIDHLWHLVLTTILMRMTDWSEP